MKLFIFILINLCRILQKEEELNLSNKDKFINSLLKYQEFISNKINNLDNFINKKNISWSIKINKLKKSEIIKANFYSNNMMNRITNYFWNKNAKNDLGFLYDISKNQYYQGNRKNNLKDGFGIIYNDLGNAIFVGNFENDYKKGYGMEIQDQNIISIGEYQNNNLEGSRILLNIKKNIKKFLIIKNGEKYKKILEYNNNGDLINLIENDELKIFENNTLFYQGDCIIYDKFTNLEYIKEGKGIEFNQNNTIKFKGLFKNNKKEGYGLSYNINGELIYSGNYMNNLKNGFGIEYLNMKILFIGIFNDDDKIQGFNDPNIDNKIHYFKNKNILSN